MEESTWTLRDLDTTPQPKAKRQRDRKPRLVGEEMHSALQERRDKMLGGMEAVYAAAQRAKEQDHDA